MSFRFSRSLVAVFVLALSVVYSVVMVASARGTGFDDAVSPDFNSDVAPTIDDVDPFWSSIRVSGAEVDEGAGLAHFTISRDRINEPFTVDVRTSDGTATAPDDYTAFSQTLNFAAGETIKVVSIPIIPDDIPEFNETFFVSVRPPGGGIGIPPWNIQVKGTIVDDDNLGELSINSVRVKEDAATATFTVARGGRMGGIISVDVATADDTAQAGQDYVDLTTTLHFAANETRKTVAVTIHPDNVVEKDETFFVNLSNPSSGVVIGDEQGVGTIVNDDTQSEFSIDDVRVKEDTGTLTFTVYRYGRTDDSVSVDVATADGTAKAGQDYVDLTTTLHFAANEKRKTVVVTIHPDDVVEKDETFFVNLSNPSAGIIRNDRGEGTIKDDDKPGKFSINDVSVKEDAATATFTITRSGRTDNIVSVDVATADDTAQAGQDYVGLTTTFYFGANETRKTVAVTIHPDNVVEPDETFFVRIFLPTSGGWHVAQGEGTILNDDEPGEFSINDVSVKEDTGTATFTITRSGRTDSSVSVDVTTINYLARAGEDYAPLDTTLHFGANETTQTVAVTIHPDSIPEPDEFFFVEITLPIRMGWRPQSVGTILNDDGILPTPPYGTPSPPRGTPPHAPLNIRVKLRQGQPLIQWRDDVKAQWYNFVIFGEPGNPTFHNLWYSKPGALNTTTDYALVECNGTTCSLDLPETKPLIGGGRYELWMRAWGTPDGTFAAGLMSRGGTASHKGMRYGAYNAVGFNLPKGRPQQPDPKGITVTTNADTGQPTIAWQAADDVIWYQVWIGSQINGEYMNYHFQDWTFAGDLDCIDPKSQCTFSLPSPLSNGTSRLLAGTYEVWLNSWGPSGFGLNDAIMPYGWAKLIELTVRGD